MPEEKTPDPKAIEEAVGKLDKFVQYLIGVLSGKNWTTKLLLLDVLLFAVFNPVFFPKILELFTDATLPKQYKLYFWLVICAVFVAAVVAAWRARPKGKPFRDPGERSTIKGLLPFGYADREIFKQLQRENDLTECCQAITDRNFRFGVLSGESGAGKTSFLQAGLWPALLEESRCVYVKFTDLDPVAAITQAFAEQKIAIPEAIPADASLSTLLAYIARADAKPLVLLLDQIEQFFVHFKRESKRRPFIRELNEWYRNGRGLPVKILICVRGDFLDHLSELQEVMGYSLGPQQKFRLKKFRPEQAAAVFRVIAEAEKLDYDESFIKELTEQELAGADDGLISPVDIQILAWMIAGQASHKERAFNRTTFQKLGGVEGLLERFLTRALEARETPARRQAATKVLLALTDLDRNARAGALTLDELKKKLGGALTDAELKEAVEWLSRGDVRLITTVKLEEADGYELAHEHLILALRRIAGKELSEADRVSLLLDRRFNEWTGNNRDRRYRLTWGELRSVKRQMPFMQWEPNRDGKQSLIAASWRQTRLRLILASLSVLLAITFASVWHSQWGQLQLIKLELAEYSGKRIDPEAQAQIARTYAVMGDFSNAFRVAENIDDDDSSKAIAIQSIVMICAKLSEKEKASRLLSQALSLVEKTRVVYFRSDTLLTLAEANATLGEKENAAHLLNQALSLTKDGYYQGYNTSRLPTVAKIYVQLRQNEKVAQLLDHILTLSKAGSSADFTKVLQHTSEAIAKYGEKNQAAQLLNQITLFAEKTNDEHLKLSILQAAALAYVELRQKERAIELLNRALLLAENIAENIKVTSLKADVLLAIAEVQLSLGRKDAAAQLLNQALSLTGDGGDEHSKGKFLRSIINVYVRLEESKKADLLLNQALILTSKIENAYVKALELKDTAQAYARLGEKRRGKLPNCSAKHSLSLRRSVLRSSKPTQFNLLQ